MSWNIQFFDLSSIKTNRPVAFIAAPDSGKSTLMMDVMYTKRKDFGRGGIVLSGSDEFTGFWEGPVPSSFIYEGFQIRAIANAVTSQRTEFDKAYKELKSKNRRASKKDVVIDPIFIIDEDNGWSEDINRDPNIRQIFNNCRHLRIFYITTQQYLMSMAKKLRDNIGYLFILDEPSKRNRRSLYEQFFGMFDTFSDFCDVLDDCTEGYGCLVLDRTQRTNNYEKCVFWYEATVRDPRSFSIGGDDYWEAHYKNVLEGGVEADTSDFSSSQSEYEDEEQDEEVDIPVKEIKGHTTNNPIPNLQEELGDTSEEDDISEFSSDYDSDEEETLEPDELLE